MTVSNLTFTPYFGSEPMPEGCCDRRKRGEPVPCCAPYPPDQLEIFRKEREAAAEKPAEPAPPPKKEKKGDLIVRFFKAIPEWFMGFFRGIWEDWKAIGRKLTRRDK